MSHRDLMRVHLETLFTFDERGRMVCVNEPAGKAAPRFFLGRTGEGREWRFRHDLSADLVQELEAACVDERVGDEFLLPPYGSVPYETALARAAPIGRKWTGPAYLFPDNCAWSPAAVLVTEKHSSVLGPHLSAWRDDVALQQPFLAVVVDGAAVSVCCSVRKTPTAHEAGVETAQEFRGLGYGAQAVGAWAQAVRDLGRIPLYSTSWDNDASRALAGRLGLVRYGTDLHIT